MDSRVLHKLEFDRVRQLLAEQAAYTGGKDQALSCAPAPSPALADQWQQETAEALALLQRFGEPPFGGVRELRATVRRAAIGSMLLPGALLDLADTLKACDKIKRYLLKHGSEVDAPTLTDLGDMLGDFPRLVAEIDRCIDEEANVLDHASPKLAQIRAKLRRTRQKVRDSLEALVRSPRGQRILQEPIITIRAGRFVVPVRQELKGELSGIVHDQSTSGATVFIEPDTVVQLNNEIRQAESEEEAEIERILIELSAKVAKEADRLIHSFDILADLDFIFAKARLARSWDAVRPEINREKRLNIVQGRHPLLTGDVVPIDVTLGGNYTALVITGPNTGGKTVTLKTVGLFALMAQAGLHLPAEPGTSMPFLNAVFADIGDEQSIEQNLSTFSSHMSQIVHMVDHVDDGTLVLLDELGAGTDPTEGSALAIAILEFFIERGALCVATTHYSELKHFAYTYPGAKNASVEFDVQTLRPTYRLTIGVAGKSNAFAIAERLGLDQQILQRARRALTENELKVEDAIRSLQDDLHQARRERDEALRLKEEYMRLVEEQKAAYDAFQQNRAKMLAEAKAESAEIIARAKLQSQELLGQLRRAGAAQLESVAGQVREAFKHLEEEFQPDPIAQDSNEPAEPVSYEPVVGMAVSVKNLGQVGEITQVLPDGKVMVQVGSIRLTLPVSDVVPAKASKSGQSASSKKSGASGVRFGGVSLAKASEMKPELHLRGLLVEEALEQLDKYLDDAVLAGLDRVRIIHGKGSGRLREAVRKFLDQDNRAVSYRFADPASGGIGVTEVDL